MKFIGVIIGLGNPEKKYQNTRHNFGSLVVETLIREKKLSFFKEGYYYKSWKWNLNHEMIWMVCKTKTYMNESGFCVKELCEEYGFNSSEFLIAHDELDLPFGRVKFKFNGGNAGHRGLESISSEIGNSFYRLRLGIGKPAHKSYVTDYVLSEFSSEELKYLPQIIDISIRGLDLFCIHGIEKAMNLVHSFSINKGEIKCLKKTN